MDFVNDVIARKRDGGALSPEHIHAFVRGVTDGSVPSYQASALLMAIVLRGLSDDETVELARAIVESGKTLDLSALRRPVLDKHSSGGVGDKVTLVLAPLVAACGAIFGKMSGRGLGHTGGTLDKLESIPGFKVQLPQGEFLRQLERIGVAVVGQSDRVAPADRVLYALRDVTGTVLNDGLIAASIMAKKVAGGTSALVLDLKVGRGAFMADLPHAQNLGRLCRLVGAAYGRPTTCIYTSMDAPLGCAIGNRLEVEEAWQVLGGEGPDDVRETVLALASALLPMADLGLDEVQARQRAEAALAEGRAAEHFERWCYVQGGRWKPGQFPRLAAQEVCAPHAGFVSAIDALAVGRAAQLSGAGRRTVDDTIDPAAGVMLQCRVGDEVGEGDLLARVFARDSVRRARAHHALAGAFAVGDSRPDSQPVVLAREG
jgi:pyrimidine-nucleoside phosphorylase